MRGKPIDTTRDDRECAGPGIARHPPAQIGRFQQPNRVWDEQTLNNRDKGGETALCASEIRSDHFALIDSAKWSGFVQDDESDIFLLRQVIFLPRIQIVGLPWAVQTGEAGEMGETGEPDRRNTRTNQVERAGARNTKVRRQGETTGRKSRAKQ